MSRLIAQIMLAVLLLPLAALVYLIAYYVFVRNQRGYFYYPQRDQFGYVFAGVLAWAFIACYWILLWRKSVAWTAGRKRWTAWSCGGALIAGAVIGAAVAAAGDSAAFGTFVGSAAAPLLWVVATILVWRETDGERAARVSKLGLDELLCPTCGYNLTGLKGTRCPECGSEFTLDALLAAQPARRQVEVEA